MMRNLILMAGMILLSIQSFSQSIYYNGAFVLEAIRDHGIQKMLDLYHNVKNKKNMTFPIFVLCLDWLFLLDLIVLNEDGEIELCT